MSGSISSSPYLRHAALVNIFDIFLTRARPGSDKRILKRRLQVSFASQQLGSFESSIPTPRGWINAFNPKTGAFLGPLRDENNQPIEIDDIGAIRFGQGGEAGSNSATNQLFFAAGPNNYANGIFGVITLDN